MTAKARSMSKAHSMSKPRKRLFVGLLSTSLVTLVLIILTAWFLTVYRIYPFQKILLIFFLVFLVGFFVLIALGIVGIVLTIVSSRTFPVVQHLIIIAINLLFPIALQLGKLFGFDQDVIKSSFIEVNNQLVRNRSLAVQPGELLLLAPHCIQKHDCPYKITLDVANCRRCGQCQVCDLLSLGEKYGVHVAVATGGTLARKFVVQHRPKAIVAIACERDLTSGIQDSTPIPVIGILNDRPHGPCFDTRIELDRVEEALRYYLTGGESA